MDTTQQTELDSRIQRVTTRLYAILRDTSQNGYGYTESTELQDALNAYVQQLCIRNSDYSADSRFRLEFGLAGFFPPQDPSFGNTLQECLTRISHLPPVPQQLTPKYTIEFNTAICVATFNQDQAKAQARQRQDNPDTGFNDLIDDTNDLRRTLQHIDQQVKQQQETLGLFGNDTDADTFNLSWSFNKPDQNNSPPASPILRPPNTSMVKNMNKNAHWKTVAAFRKDLIEFGVPEFAASAPTIELARAERN